MSDRSFEAPPRIDGSLALLPVAWVTILALSAITALALAGDLFDLVGTRPGPVDEQAAAMSIAVMRWAPLWCVMNAALATTAVVALVVAWRLARSDRQRLLAIGLPIVAAAPLSLLVLFGPDPEIGPEMTDDPESLFRSIRVVVRMSGNVLMLIAAFAAVSASVALTRAASRSPGGPGTATSTPGESDEGFHRGLTRSLRLLTVSASLSLVLGAAQVRMLYMVAVTETGQPYLEAVADHWGIAVGAIYSLVLVAIYVPPAIALRVWSSDADRPAPSGADSSSAHVGSGHRHPMLVATLIRVEPVLALIAPFLSGLLASFAP